MQTYSAIFPSRTLKNVENCVKGLALNSKSLDKIVVIWDGSKDALKNPVSQMNNVDIEYVHNPSLDVYGMFNYGASFCKSDFLMFLNDDMYFPPNWDNPLPMQDNAVITFVVVEPGFVKVNEKNIERNFGFNWDEFRKKEFEDFCNSFQEKGTVKDGKMGWYTPVMLSRNLFMAIGQFPTEPPFPHPNDIAFFENLKNKPNTKFLQVMSPVYHFQMLSHRKLKQTLFRRFSTKK